MAFKFLKGFSFIEVLVAVAVIAIILTMATQTLKNFNNEKSLDAETNKIISIINEARSNTSSSKNFIEHGIHFEQSKITFFKGTAYNSSDPNNKEYKISGPVEIYNISLNGGSQDLFFKKLTGETDKYGTIGLRLINNLLKIKTIKISQSGVVNVY